jgi:NTE family protein
VAREEGADVVIAVAVDRGLSPREDLRTVVDIYHRASEIMGEKLKVYELAEANVVILPEVGELHWSNFSQAMNLIEEGEKAAQRKIGDIRQSVPGIKKWLTFRKGKKPPTKRV